MEEASERNLVHLLPFTEKSLFPWDEEPAFGTESTVPISRAQIRNSHKKSLNINWKGLLSVPLTRTHLVALGSLRVMKKL